MAIDEVGGEGPQGSPDTEPASPLILGDLFFGLRQAGLSVGVTDWMTLMDALFRGAIKPDLTDFYYVARALLVKDETRFDLWDQVFAAVFAEGEMPRADVDKFLDWLSMPKPPPQMSAEEMAAMMGLSLEALRKQFEERLKDQKERHDGGSKWIGTGGRSPFGHGGVNPAGVRVGGSGGGRSAIQIATARDFAQYRKDRILDTRSMAVALRRLRRLSRKEGAPELDIEGSIDATCRNAGELTLTFEPPRTNQSRVLLLMDVGGSMDPFSQLVERLFSAASSLGHWKKMEAFSFHNCVYADVFPQDYGHNGVATADILRDRPDDTMLIIVGDAAMAPSELTEVGGTINYWEQNGTPGLQWLHRLRSRFKRSIWLNPLQERWWTSWTTDVIRQVYPMFPLTLEGLDRGIDQLLRRNPPPPPPLDPAFSRSRRRY